MLIAETEWSLIASCSSSAHDLRYQCSGDQLTSISYLQHLSGYKHQLPHIYDSINPTDSHRSYPGLHALPLSTSNLHCCSVYKFTSALTHCTKRDKENEIKFPLLTILAFEDLPRVEFVSVASLLTLMYGSLKLK